MTKTPTQAAQEAYRRHFKSLCNKIDKRRTKLRELRERDEPGDDADENLKEIAIEIAELERQLANDKANRKSFVSNYIIKGSPAIQSLLSLPAAPNTMDSNDKKKPPMTPVEKKEAFALEMLKVGEKEAVAAAARALAQEESVEALGHDARAAEKRADNYKFAADIYMGIQDEAIRAAHATVGNSSFDTGVTFDSTSFDSSSVAQAFSTGNSATTATSTGNSATTATITGKGGTSFS